MLNSIVKSNWFNHLILGAVLVATVLVGIETYRDFVAQHEGILRILNQIVLYIFIIEIVIKVGAEGRKPWQYFLDPWNVFDFIIVAIYFLPFGGNSVIVLRLLRILRAMRLVTVLSQLQILVGALVRSIPSIGHVALLLFIHFYIYATMATYMYGENDPVHFRNLQLAMLSLFRVVTLEDWTDIMYINMYGCDQYGYDGIMERCTNPSAAPVGAAIFFVSFVMIGAMIILNLFIGVVLTAMQEMQEKVKLEAASSKGDEFDPHLQIALLDKQLEEIRHNLRLLTYFPLPPEGGWQNAWLV